MNPLSKEQERSQQIAKLTRDYAQNRSLGVVVGLLLFTVQFAAIGLLSYFGGVAYRDGNQLLFWITMAALVPVLATVVYMSVPKWGGQRIEALTSRLYREGNASITVPDQKGRAGLALVMAIAFGCCILASVLLGFFEIISPKYAQPVSALFVVPFLVGLNLLMRPTVSKVSLLWPILYGLHAILIVAGVPIAFTGTWQVLNIALPIVGYGLIAAMLAYVCNRYALHKLQQTIQVGGRQTEDGHADDKFSGDSEGVSQ